MSSTTLTVANTEVALAILPKYSTGESADGPGKRYLVGQRWQDSMIPDVWD